MKSLLVFFAAVCSVSCSASVLFDPGLSSNCASVSASSASCASVKAAVQACMVSFAPSWVTSGCSSDPVVNGTTFSYVFNGVAGSGGGVMGLHIVCASGTHVDSSTNTCVDDVTIAVASCMPSIRTISPCPSGYAPTNAIPAGSGAPNPFISAMDGMPLQDMIYAVGVAICGLMGIAVGIKLV